MLKGVLLVEKAVSRSKDLKKKKKKEVRIYSKRKYPTSKGKYIVKTEDQPLQ